MRITWVTRSFLDYRIPVYEHINRLCGNKLTVIYFKDVVPDRCQNKLISVLGNRAIGLTGELRFTGKKSQPISNVRRNKLRIPFQPGLIREIKKSNPDIVLSDGFFQWTYANLWIRLLKNVPHLMLYEGTMHTERNAGKVRTLYRKIAYNFIDRIACNGILSMQYIESIGYPSSRISLGNMAADSSELELKSRNLTEHFKQKFKSEMKLEGKVMLFAGRLVPLKGIDKLLNAWAEIFSNGKSIHLLIVGDGPEGTSLREFVQNNKLNNVHFTGGVDYDTIHLYFGIADIFIIPSLQDNWSLVVPEAMSCKLPVISSKYNGCWPELVKPENGWVFDPLDSENFGETLKIAWDHQDIWKKMGEQSLKIIEDYAPNEIAKRIYSACTKTIQSLI